MKSKGQRADHYFQFFLGMELKLSHEAKELIICREEIFPDTNYYTVYFWLAKTVHGNMHDIQW